MSESTKEDLEQARDAIIARLDAMQIKADIAAEGFRQQQSAEHGAHQASLMSIRESLNWIRAQWIRFSKP